MPHEALTTSIRDIDDMKNRAAGNSREHDPVSR